MPALLVISASGTAQRRLLEETEAELEKKGFVPAGRQEGGEWVSLLSDNLSGGLFDENRYIVVESASELGPFPEKLAYMADPQGAVALILVYDTDSQGEGKRAAGPSKLIPKEVLAKCRMLRAAEFPRWPRERQQWVLSLAKELKVALSRGAVAMLVELTDDPEEIRSQLKSLGLLRKAKEVDEEDVKLICLDDGSRNLLRLLDGLCTGNFEGVTKSIASTKKRDDVNSVFTPVHNRMRLAWYAGMGKEAALFAKALGAKDYAWRMGKEADSLYGHRAISEFIAELLSTVIEERGGVGSGWNGFETAIVRLLSKGLKRKQR